MTGKTTLSGAVVVVLVVVLTGLGGSAAAQHVAGTTPQDGAEDVAEMEVTDLEPTDATVRRGDEITVSANVTNVGNASGTANVSLLVEDAEITSREVTINESETQPIEFSMRAGLGPGEYNLTIATADDSETGTLTVEDRHECRPYVDEDGIATLDGALDAIDDYENGDLSLEGVLLVIDSYEQQVPLEELREDDSGGTTLTWCY